MLEAPDKPHIASAPFRGTLSLDLLLDFWQAEQSSNAHGLSAMAKEINEHVARAPELRGPLASPAVLERYPDLVGPMFSVLLPAGLKNMACTAVCHPSSWDFFHSTPRFRRELLSARGSLRGELLLDGMTWDFLGRLYRYLGVLRSCYGINMQFEKSVLVQVENEQTGLLSCFQLRAQLDMMRVRPTGEIPPLDQAILEQVKADMTSFDLWARLLPYDAFEYYGMMVYEATEVTEEVTRAQLTELLVEADPLIELDRFNRIEKLLRTFLKLPNLELAVIGIEGDSGFCMDGHEGLRHDLDARALDSLICPHDRSDLSCGETVVHSDLAEIPLPTDFMRNMVQEGARSFLMTPIRGQDGLSGALVLSTDKPGQLSMLTKLRLKGLLPIFSQALQRTLADVQARVQAVLKEKFTSIHPAVEWKFRAAALRYVHSREIGDVVFPDVHSLYSASDIRSSSDIRNRAIQSDLIRQVETAKEVLHEARGRREIEYLSSLIYRLEGLVAELEGGVRSGDEARVARLLASEVEPIFGSLEVLGSDVHSSIEGYRGAVCEDSGSLYTERRAYEDSVDRLASVQTAILQEAQERAQRVFPHLFQMYRTDGVEHSIYVGSSLTERTDFSLLYLKDLRLWQLRVVARLARASARLERELTVPLKVAHLILAQSDPIALRFSQEEKKFNVDGAYNIRYEIIKKRIDKAHVKGTDERLTQPGKIAIFYSQAQEEQEYGHFIDYLQQRGELEREVERLDVEDLQGVHGLRALRVAVNLQEPEENPESIELAPGLKKNQ
jgi:hypothetical protein